VAHPLDPLSADEFASAAAILRREHGVQAGGPPPAELGWRFASIELTEPTKAELREFERAGTAPDRRATVICLNRATNATYKSVVSLRADRVESFEHVPGVQANFTVDEFLECDQLLRTHPELLAALAKRGIDDVDLVFFDTWTYGDAVAPPEFRDRRLGWSDTWLKDGPGMNPYAHLISGLHCVIDVNAMEVLRVEDGAHIDIPRVMGEYVPRHIPERIRSGYRRDPLKPLHITQPDGPSFTLDGNLLQWQNWSLRIGFNYREGMTLHALSYRDGERIRPVAHRLSFAEMVVPYRDPSADHYRRTAFDIGEWGLGFMTQSLELGCDCLGEIRYLDAVLHDSTGEPYPIANAICIHEEDNAVLWKHVDHDTGAEVRRMRRLTLSFHVTVANYEYLVYWRLHQDGNIECEVRATGIMVTTPLAPGAPNPNGTLVDERTYAPFHQHFLVARLDLDIDGPDNTVFMTESFAEPIGADNPHGLSVVVRNVPLRTEQEGMQDVDFGTQRAWKVMNTNVVNGIGTHPSYKLVPTGALPPMFDPASPVMKRANVIGHTLWVTPNDPAQRWPAGEFVNQSVADTGLGEWTKANRSIENTDVVLWYVFGLHHITRPEDWPVMPVDVVSFWLKPFGFFDRNPALDVPAGAADACHAES
jgi:primary-amine oxidase